MSSPLAPMKPRPKPPLVMTIGTLNIVFGCLLMLCGPCLGIYMFALPAIMPVLQQQQDAVRQRWETKKKTEVDALAQQEQAAQTDVDKARIRAERMAKQAETLPITPTPDISQMGLTDLRVRGHYLADATTCFVLNLAMMISGIGIVRLSRWGRSLGIMVGWLKIIRLVALTLSMLLVVAPLMNAKSAEFFVDGGIQAGAKPGVPDEKRQKELADASEMLWIFNVIFALSVLVLGSIYPATTLFVLHGRNAREAFGANPPPEV